MSIRDISFEEQMAVVGGNELVDAAGIGGAVGSGAGLVIGVAAKGTLSAAAIGAAGFGAIGIGIGALAYGVYKGITLIRQRSAT